MVADDFTLNDHSFVKGTLGLAGACIRALLAHGMLLPDEITLETEGGNLTARDILSAIALLVSASNPKSLN